MLDTVKQTDFHLISSKFSHNKIIAVSALEKARGLIQLFIQHHYFFALLQYNILHVSDVFHNQEWPCMVTTFHPDSFGKQNKSLSVKEKIFLSIFFKGGKHS